MSKFLILLVIVWGYTSAQQWKWAKAFGRPNFYEQGMNISTDKENNIYISGSSKTVCHRCPSYYFSILSKFDPNGNHIWTDTIPFYEQKSVTDLEGNTYVASDGRYAKYDKNGIKLWQKDNPTERWSNLAIHPKGGFVASGSDPATQADALIARFDGNGNLLWKRSGDTWAQCCAPDQITCDKQGNVYFTAGADTAQNFLNRSFLFKFTEDGQLTYKIRIPQQPAALCVGSDNAPVVAGIIHGPAQIGNLTYQSNWPIQGYLVKYDSSGKEAWHHIINSPIFTVRDLEINKHNEIFLGGSVTHSLTVDAATITANYATYVIKLSPEGKIIWTQNNTKDPSKTGNPYFSNLKDMVVNSSGNIIITGVFSGDSKFGDHTLYAPQMPDYYFDVLLAEISGNSGSSVDVTEIQTEKFSALSIFPNPGDRFFSVNIENRQGPCTLTVMDVLGAIIFTESLDIKSEHYNTALDFQGVPKGVYFVTLTGTNFSESKKIVLR